MSLDTLLEAARYIEQQEQKQQRLAAKRRTSSFCRIEEEPFRSSNGHVAIERERHASVGSDRSHRSSTSVTTNHSLADESHNRITLHGHNIDENGANHSEPIRRRTNSSSIGPCILRSSKVPGTREVHNKLEKNRRAHLKECFELLKDQLPPSPDEKKASNLSILGSAIRYIQLLRRKERDFENEMERLARDKIVSQQRITALKRELSSRWEHIDFSTLLPEEATSKIPDREHPHSVAAAPPLGLRAEHRYSSSSSLSSAATAPSPSAVPTNTQMTTSSTSPVTTQLNSSLPALHKSAPNASTISQVIQVNHNQHIITNGNAIGSNLKILSANNTAGSQIGIKREINMYTKQVPANNKINSTFGPGHLISQNALISNGKIARLDGQQQVKLINGSPSLTLVTQSDNDKDSLKVQPTQITLSQVIPGGSLVVSPIQLSLAPQNIRVLSSSAGGLAATIEIATSSTTQRLRDTSATSSSHIRKILIPQSTVGNPVVAVPQENGASGPLGGRLPGGAELNLLPTSAAQQSKSTSHQQNILYRPTKAGGALAIVNNGITLKSGCATSLSGLTPLVVSQSQSGQVAHLVAAPSQLGGKVVTTSLLKSMSSNGVSLNPQYLSATLVKPMVVVSTSGGALPSSTSAN